MKPTVGRVVHYTSYGTPPRPDGSQAYTSQCRAAIVTEVKPETDDNLAQAEIEGWSEEAHHLADLCVLNPEGQFFKRGVQFDANRAGGTWHWPEREQ